MTDNQAADTMSRMIVFAVTLVSIEQRQDTSMAPLITGQTSLTPERVQILHSRDDFLCDIS